MVDHQMARRGNRRDIREYDRRFALFLLVSTLIFGALGLQLWKLQIVDGEKYYRASTENIVRHVEVKAPRGEILDRHGVALVRNRPAYDVYVEPTIFLSHADDEVYRRLQEYLHLSDRQLEQVQSQLSPGGAEVAVRRNVARPDVARLEEDLMRLPGVEVRTNLERYYPLHHVGAHALGYVGEVSSQQLGGLRPLGYRRGDRIGQMGLEKAYEGVLHGSPGLQRRVVDALGNPRGEAETQFLIGEYQHVQPVPGRDLVTTLDADLMVMIDEAIEDYAAGAAVAVDPNDGSVLAMYSKPHFNPNAWSGRLTAMEKMRSDNNPFRPMIDKTINGYFPGSVYKIVGSVAGLSEGMNQPHDQSFCRGHFNFGGHRFRCWRDHGHGRVDAYTAMAQSCDVYFYEIGDELGMETLADYAHRFGFGELTGIDLPQERPGRVPSRAWHEENSPEGYQRGFDINTVIGQGDTLVTPLQMAMAYAAIANGGELYYPRLVAEIRSRRGQTLFEFEPTLRKRLEIDEEHLQVLRESLRQVVHGPRGTARGSALEHAEVAGKTGTAQVAQIGVVRIPHAQRELHLRNHAWFVAYAPYDDPEIAIAVFLEHGGGGGGDAAPVAMEILDRYLTREEPRALATRAGDWSEGEGLP